MTLKAQAQKVGLQNFCTDKKKSNQQNEKAACKMEGTLKTR